MSYLDIYKKRVRGQGESALEVRTNASKQYINRNFTNAHGYQRAIMYTSYTDEGTDIDVVVESLNSELEKDLIFRPDTVVNTGSYISYNKKFYIVREVDVDQITPKATTFLCNRHINLKGFEKNIPCYTNSTTYGSKGILDQGKFYELDSKTKIYVQLNEVTQTMKIGQRVMFANRYVYKITEIDDLVFPNMLSIVAERDETLPMDDFENNLAWNEHDSHEEPKQVSRVMGSKITGSEKIKFNESDIYTINKPVAWRIDDETIATIVSKTETKVEIRGIKRGWVTLTATDNGGVQCSLDIMVC